MQFLPRHSTGRLYQFDLIRLTLVLFALASHYMTSQHWDELTGNNFFYLKVLTRTAMPCLLILFGFMIEYVYARRWKEKGARTVLRKLSNRAMLCYLAFVTLTIVGILGGYNAWWKGIANFFMLFPATHANLFKYYTILIPLIYCLTWIRIRFGWIWKILAISLIIGAAEWITSTAVPLPGAFRHMAGLLFGWNNVWGPSISHALILVLFGELMANFISGSGTRTANLSLAFLITGALIRLSLEINRVGFSGFFQSIVDYNQYRAHNSAVYFTFGMVTILVFTFLASLLVNALSGAAKERITYYGGSTLTVFYYGNMIILLTPQLNIGMLYSGIILFITLGLSIASVNIIDRAYKEIKGVRLILQGIQYFSDWITDTLIRIFGRKKKVLVTPIQSTSFLQRSKPEEVFEEMH